MSNLKIHPLELLENLAFNVSPNFNFVRLKSCMYKEKDDRLEVSLIYSEKIESELELLKGHLEQEFQSSVVSHLGEIINIEFRYEKAYIDAILLKLYLVKYLKSSFVLAMDIDEEDVVVKSNDGFFVELFLTKQNAQYIKNGKVMDSFLDGLRKEYFDEFSYVIRERESRMGESEESFIDKFTKENEIQESARIDKVMKIGKKIEYYLGRPIKERPIRVEFLRVSGDDQVIAGTIRNFTRREFTTKPKADDEGGEKKPFFTFMLDDGKNKASCVHFPNTNTLAKFEKLVDGTAVCMIGQNTERNGRIGFRVSGVSFCELKE